MDKWFAKIVHIICDGRECQKISLMKIILKVVCQKVLLANNRSLFVNK